jgi:ribosome biogenesis GTPase
MSKRRISDQQSRRIQSRRTQATPLAGDSDTLGAEQHGLIISRFGKQVDVEDDNGHVQRCYLRTHLDQLACGDRVLWRASLATDASAGVVVAALPRKNVLARPDDRGRLRPVAANVDRMFIVIAPQPEPFTNLIDRYLVNAETDKLEALLVLNKTDLLNGDANSEAIETLLARYEKIGYRVLRTCCKDAQSLLALQNELPGYTSVFVGQSGVGKSSLINTLMPGLAIRVGELSEAEAKGKHTTTTSRLYHFPAGGELIDSPGIRDFSLSHLNEAQIADGFRDLHPFLGHCQFRDCRHREEPVCALKQAAETGAIDATRWHSYLAIRESLNSP